MKKLHNLWHSLICGCKHKHPEHLWSGWARLLFPLMSALALGWFLVRVIPKPIRATYPCQQAAFPVVSASVIWLLGCKVSLLAWVRRSARLKQWRVALGVSAGVCLFGLAALAASEAVKFLAGSVSPNLWTPTDPPNSPLGVARGINPGRVVWVHDPLSTTWDGNKSNNTYWWDQNGADQARVDAMLSRSLRMLTGTNSDTTAWDLLFTHFNQRHDHGNRGYQAGERIAIKINQNTARTGYALNGNTGNYGEFSINGNPQLIKALLRQLVNQAGVPQTNITVYDASRWMADSIYLPNHQEFPSVHFMDGHGGQGRELVSWSSTNAVFYAVEHSLGRKLPLQVLNAGYVINMSIMKNHGDGPTLTGKNHYGSINGQGDHNAIYQSSGMNTYANLVDLMGHKDLGEKTVLFMTDALYGSSSPDADPSKWSSAPFNGWWPSSLFLAQDGVALDSVGFDFMNTQWGMNANSDNYLHEAARATNPPSGVIYAPNGDGLRISSLGAHEHWNNSTGKQYTRNLSTNGTGIELCKLEPGLGLTIAITNPANGAVVGTTSNLTLMADGGSVYSSIRKVDFYRAWELIGTVTNSPFFLVWRNAPVGTWALKAVLTDSDNICATSAVVNLTVQPPANVAPFVLTQPANQAVLLGANVVFTIDAGGWPAPSCQWRKEGTNLPGATSATLTLNSVSLSAAGGYCAVLSNAAGVVTSAVATLAVLLPPTNFSFIPTGALWRYYGNTQDLGTNWRTFAYDDSTWSNGLAELGFGDTKDGRPEATIIASNNQWTTYFRRAFVASNLNGVVGLQARLLRDDGAVVYLNEREIFRDNLSTGTIFYNSPASAACSDDGTVYYSTNVSASLLVPGTNLVAVEVHQNALSSTDLSFNFELVGQRAAQLPVFLSQPDSQTRLAGSSVLFCGAAASATALSYSWLSNGVPITGATNTCLTLMDLSPQQTALYSLVASNAAGMATSAPASLVVVSLPALEIGGAGADGFRFQFNGGLPGSVLGSSNLTDWIVLTNFPGMPGVIQISDPAAAGLPWRFYRIRLD